jgi:putative solute:sodium symporter small subunit
LGWWLWRGCIFTDQLADTMTIAAPFNAWYAEGGAIAVVVILLFALYGFQMSRAGNPLLPQAC